jgi:hypothetical protein
MKEIEKSKNYVVVLVIVCLMFFCLFIVGKVSTTINTGLIRYQEFQEIYNTTVQINQNLCNLSVIKDNDKMFKDFSKSQQVLALKSNMNRWIGEYNAKSTLINFNVWKSDTLPYSLTTNLYNCL